MHEYKAEVIRVVDGDTVDLNIDLGMRVWTRQRIRLLGIDAPEKRGDSRVEGHASLGYLQQLLYQMPVIVRTEKTGKFGRWLGTLYVNGIDINQKMIDDGHAVEYGK